MKRLRLALLTGAALLALNGPSHAQTYDPTAWKAVTLVSPTGVPVSLTNPQTAGARGATATPTAVTNGQTVALMADKSGKLITKPYAPDDLDWQSFVSIATSTEATVKAAGGAGVRTYVTGISCANGAATVNTINVRDGLAGTTVAVIALAASDSISWNFATPLKGTANTVLTWQLSAATAVFCTFTGFVGP